MHFRNIVHIFTVFPENKQNCNCNCKNNKKKQTYYTQRTRTVQVAQL